MNKKTKVTVCVASLNCLPFLKGCIQKLTKATSISIEILILDLGSDGTYEWCKEKGITVFRKKLPFYFSQSNNFLVSKSSSNLILFLNPDTEPQKKFLEKMIDEMEKYDAGIVGCKLLFPNGRIQHAGVEWKQGDELPSHIGYNDLDYKHYSMSYESDGVTAACMLIKKDLFKKLKGFDEGFKNGYEDVDLCLRAVEEGAIIRYCGKGRVIHHEGAVMGIDGKERTSLQFFEKNKKYLLSKHKRK